MQTAVYGGPWWPSGPVRDRDRYNFWYRIRNWEAAQSAVFGRSVNAAISGCVTGRINGDWKVAHYTAFEICAKFPLFADSFDLNPWSAVDERKATIAGTIAARIVQSEDRMRYTSEPLASVFRSVPPNLDYNAKVIKVEIDYVGDCSFKELLGCPEVQTT